MAEHGPADLYALVRWGDLHGAFVTKEARAARRNYAIGDIGGQVVRELVGAVDAQRHAETEEGRPPFPPPEGLDEGDVELTTWHGPGARLPAQVFTTGTCIVGPSGSGKSTVLFGLLIQLARVLSLVSWFFEFHKTASRSLLRPYVDVGRPLVVVRPEDFAFGLLDPGPLDPHLFYVLVCERLVQGLALESGSRSETLLREALYHEFDVRGVFKGSGLPPCLGHLRERVQAWPDAHVAARDNVADRLGEWMMILPAARDVQRGLTVETLAAQSVVFEFAALPLKVTQFLVDLLLGAVFAWRVRGTVTASSRPPLTVWIEDAQMLAAADPARPTSPLTQWGSVLRGSAVGLGLVFQSFDKVPPGLLANLGTTVVLGAGHEMDWLRLAGKLNWSPAQLAWARAHLGDEETEPVPHRYAIVEVPSGPWHHRSFVIRVPKVELEPVDDAACRGSVEPLLRRVRIVRAPKFGASWALYRPRSADPAGGSGTGGGKPTWSAGDLRFLRAVVEAPGQPASAYGTALGLSGTRAGAVRERFVAAGILHERLVQLKPKGRPAMLLEPTKAAETLLKASEAAS